METLTSLIKSGDAEGVQRLLDRNPEVLNSPVEGAPSALLLAKYYGRDGVVDVIRRYRPKLDVFEAAAVGDRHQLETLLAADSACHTQVSADGFTPLGYAAFFGHSEALRDLLDAGADPCMASTNPLGVLPLHSALANGHKEMARLLVERGTDVDAASAAGWTPLHYAAERGDIETAKFLLDHHAKRDVRSADGQAPYEIAEAKGFTDLAEILRPVGA